MKPPKYPSTRLTLLSVLIMFLAGIELAAQHPLVGTWEMISVKGVGADGKSFFLDTTSVRETKVITPTHYMLIAWDVESDSLIFNRAMAGNVKLEGSKYIEVPTQASVQIFENITVDFSWKLEGDIFTQSGRIIRPDGKTVVLEALVFKRVTNVKPHEGNQAIGAWGQVSGSSKTADGRSALTFNPADTRMLLITPTHWMRIDHRNKKFDGASYGRYQMKNGTVDTRVDFSTYPSDRTKGATLTQKIDGQRLYLISEGKSPEGRTVTISDVFERLE